MTKGAVYRWRDKNAEKGGIDLLAERVAEVVKMAVHKFFEGEEEWGRLDGLPVGGGGHD